jgi:hypothetical protein
MRLSPFVVWRDVAEGRPSPKLPADHRESYLHAGRDRVTSTADELVTGLLITIAVPAQQGPPTLYVCYQSSEVSRLDLNRSPEDSRAIHSPHGNMDAPRTPVGDRLSDVVVYVGQKEARRN